MVSISPKEIQLVKDWMKSDSKKECHQINLKLVELGVKINTNDNIEAFNSPKGIAILHHLEKQNIYPIVFKYGDDKEDEFNYNFYEQAKVTLDGY